MALRVTFLGAAGTVTGSKYVLEANGGRMLVDCGLFQGPKPWRERNWAPLPVQPRTIDAVVLTHAHLDHSGYLPLLVREGFAGKIFCTPATEALCGILLPDSGHLQEEQARHANRHRYSKHDPALPLYTRHDAEVALARIHHVPFGRAFTPLPWMEACFHRAGHILGAASVSIESTGTRLLCSGDLGRRDDLLMQPPEDRPPTEYVIMESTYGDRKHASGDPRDVLADVIRRTSARDGVVVVPAFAVGRAQALLWLLRMLKQERRIPESLPIFLNSPMAADVTGLYIRFAAEHRLSRAECEAMCRGVTIVNSEADSRAINARRGPMVIVSASGMATGGRVLHHLRAFAPDPRNTILLTGFQAEGTRGRALQDGAAAVKMLGEMVPIRAEVVSMDNLSAHADADGLIGWLRSSAHQPRKVFLTHGEPHAASALQSRVADELGWACEVPAYLQTVELA